MMRILQLFVTAMVMVAISLSWVMAVDLTPASQRPYVGSSQDNSELSLAIGYNGVQRLLGSIGFGGAGTRSTTQTGQTTQEAEGNTGGQPPQGFGNANGGPGGGTTGMFNTGTPGLFRLFNEPLGGQIVWLLPFALLGMLAVAWQRRPRLTNFREDREQQSLVLWGIWLLTIAAFFSAANFFHQYYLSTLAPAICALFGIGVVVMWRDYRRIGWRGWLLPIALFLTALEQIHIILSNSAWGTWLIPVIAIPCAVGGVILIMARALPNVRFNARVLLPALGLALCALLITPTVWAAVPGVENIAADLPTVGPTQAMGGGGQGGNHGLRGLGGMNGVYGKSGLGGPTGAYGANGQGNGVTENGTGSTRNQQMQNGGPGGGVSTALINYLEANQGSAEFLVAVPSSGEASSIILATNKPVMAMGGFSGSDPILTASSVAQLVAQGKVRFFLLSGNGGGGAPGRQQSSSVTSWVTQHCSVVSSSKWQSSTSSSSTSSNSGAANANNGGSQLYSCTSTSTTSK